MKAYDKKCAGCEYSDGMTPACWWPATRNMATGSFGPKAQAFHRRKQGICSPVAKLFEAKEGAATMDSVFLTPAHPQCIPLFG